MHYFRVSRTGKRDRKEFVGSNTVAQQLRHTTGGGQSAECTRWHYFMDGAGARAQHEPEVFL
jgi:hypothetical protein